MNAWLIEAGLLDIVAGDLIALVVETGCRYARPLAYPEPIEVGMAIETLGRSSIRYALGSFALGAEEAAAEGFLVHVLVDRAGRRPMPLPAAWRVAAGTLALR